MKVELKQVIDQLTEALNLTENVKVCALIDDSENIVGWNVVDVNEDGKITPQFDSYFKNLKELINFYI
jgi:hypothetical protein